MKKATKFITLLCASLLILATASSCDLFKTADESETINVTVLSGTTGFGAAKLISDSKDDDTAQSYSFTVETDPSLARDGLINGSVDIAALPTNVAATLYNKTGGKVKIAAVNTLGVLYLVTNGEEVATLADITGKTVYCPANNPAYLFEAICRANGLEKDADYTLQTVNDPKEIPPLLIKGEATVAVLPEPLVTAAKSKLSTLETALDLTDEWERVYGENTIMQGCIAVRAEWAEAHPEELEKFLEEYKVSVEFTNADPKTASELIVAAGIAESAPIAEAAIPRCNIVYIDGDDMASALDVFFEKLYSISPAAIGGKLPDSGIYIEK